MAEEPINSFRDEISKRMSSPVFGVLLFFWFVFNWKIIVTLMFSSLEVIERINLIEKNYYSILNGAIYPIIATVVYLLVNPYIVSLVRVYSENVRLNAEYKIKKNEIEHDIELKERLHDARDRTFHKMLNEIYKRHEALEKIDSMKEVASRLEQQIISLDKTSTEVEEETKKQLDSLKTQINALLSEHQLTNQRRPLKNPRAAF